MVCYVGERNYLWEHFSLHQLEKNLRRAAHQILSCIVQHPKTTYHFYGCTFWGGLPEQCSMVYLPWRSEVLLVLSVLISQNRLSLSVFFSSQRVNFQVLYLDGQFQAHACSWEHWELAWWLILLSFLLFVLKWFAGIGLHPRKVLTPLYSNFFGRKPKRVCLCWDDQVFSWWPSPWEDFRVNCLWVCFWIFFWLLLRCYHFS